MSIEITNSRSDTSLPVWFIQQGKLQESALPHNALAWAKSHDFEGKSGEFLVIPSENGALAGALFGLGSADTSGQNRLLAGELARKLPQGDWHVEGELTDAHLQSLAFLMGGYRFDRYRKNTSPRQVRLALPDGIDASRITPIAAAVTLTRDLINTPTNDMGPQALEDSARSLAKHYGATFNTITGDALLAANLPMIHAVGRAAEQAPRLIDMTWGNENHPKVTLVGKGVCFDTGGLDIKSPSSMLLMKKDMGGAANVLGLAMLIMESRLPLRLRVLIPAVENSIAGNAFRPGDILKSRKGLSVEIGNTDAEGRLVLADALALADEEEPELLIDMATLTGAARVALGPDLPPFYTHNDALALKLADSAQTVADPLWRMPLWHPYEKKFSSRIADLNNVTTDGFAGSVIAALFLSRFVEKAQNWMHFDIYGWNPVEKPYAPIGGEAQGIRAIHHLLQKRYGTQ